MKSSKTIELNAAEKEYLTQVLSEEIAHMKRDGATIIEYDTPKFLAAEERLNEFLTKLLKKLQKE